MAKAFTEIPANLLVPGQYQEIDNSLAGETSEIKKVLLIGVKSKIGKAEVGKPIRIISTSKANEDFGFGSPLAIMTDSFLQSNKVEQLYALALQEPDNGVAWKKEFTVETTSIKSGTIKILINDKSVLIKVNEDDTAEKICASLVAACNSLENNPLESTVDTDEPTKFSVASIVKGVSGNANSVSFISQTLGVKINEGTVTEGVGFSDISKLADMLGSQRWNYIVFDFDDDISIKILADELESRYSATRQIGGRAFIAISGDVKTMLEKAKKINSPHICLIPRGKDNYFLPCQWTASFAAAACRVLADDPSANTYDTKVKGLAQKFEYDFDTRQKLLEAGIATWRLDPTGSVLIERLTTSYTQNADGGRDTSYLDIQVVETVDAVRSYINAEAKKRFKKWKLTSTDENFGAGAKVMTPGIWRSFLADLYQTVFIGEKNWCQDFEGYKASISVEVKAGNKTRLEYMHQPVLIGQFLIGAGLNQFK
ncbi:MAG: phage tail sheath protein [Treponemataceae bacterium]